MTAEEATKISSERKPIIQKELFNVLIAEVYKNISRCANNGEESTNVSIHGKYEEVRMVSDYLLNEGYVLDIRAENMYIYWGNLALSVKHAQKNNKPITTDEEMKKKEPFFSKWV